METGVKQTGPAIKGKEKKQEKTKAKPEMPKLADYPRVSMYENDKRILLAMEMPGLTRKDVTLNFNIRSVDVLGKKRNALPNKENEYKISELKYGIFSRKIELPHDIDVARSKVKAKIKNGLFLLDLKKKNYSKLKEAEIK